MSDSRREHRVVKLGGSLLDFYNLRQHLEQWLSRQKPATTLWIIGGGQPVEELRRRHDRQESDSEVVHWRCIEIMDDNALRVASWFPSWKRFETMEDLNAIDSSGNLIVSHFNWTRQNAAHLPASWDVTSDSIAATLANWSGANELVLLKSSDPPDGARMESAMEIGYLDRYFLEAFTTRDLEPRTCAGYSVRVVNLRNSSFRETTWRE